MQVFSALFRIASIASIAAFLAGCKTLSFSKGEKSEEAPAEVAETPPPPVMKIPVGTIHHVDSSGGFVLIRSSRTLHIEPDTVISVFNDQGEVAATVKVSPARKGQFFTADILSGVPKTGQQATMDHAARRPEPSPSGRPEQTSSSDVQVLE